MLPLVVVRRVVFGLLGSLTPLCGAQMVSLSSPTFVVATIKPSDPNRAEDDGSIGFSPGGFDAKSQSLRELIEFTQDLGYYNVDQRIVGGPRWIVSSRFDIEAKCDEETARAFGKMPLKQQAHTEQNMVQAILADRFTQQTHHEMRRLAVYALVQEKSGSKVKPSAKAGEKDEGGAEGSPGNWEGNGVTMAELASDLAEV